MTPTVALRAEPVAKARLTEGLAEYGAKIRGAHESGVGRPKSTRATAN